MSSVCIGLAPFLPSSPAPPVSYSLVVVLSPRWAPPLQVYWLTHQAMVPLRFCAVLSVSSLAHPSAVMILFYSSVFVSSAVCLRRVCSLVSSRWGHPRLGRVLGLVSPTRSERRLSLLVSFVFLWDGVTLWVKCVLPSPLISIAGLLLLLVSVPSGWGPMSGAFACPLFSLVRLHRLPLCSSSLLCVASFCSVGFLLLASFLASTCWAFSHCFFIWLSFVIVACCVLCLSLPLVFHFAVLGSPPVVWWPSVFFWPCSLLFSGAEVPFLLSQVSAPRV